MLIPQWHATDQEPAVLSIGAAMTHFVLERRTRSQRRLPFAHMAVKIIRMKRLPPIWSRLFCIQARIFVPTAIYKFRGSVGLSCERHYRYGVNNLAKLLFALADSFFGAQPVSDVPGNHKQEATTAIRDHARVYFDRKHRPIPSPMPVCVEYGLTGRCPLGDGFLLCFIGIRMEGEGRVADQFLPRVTKALAGRPVHINNGLLLEIVDKQGVPRVVHKCAKARLTLAQRFLGALALCDIDVCADYADRLAALGGNMMANCLDIFKRSIGQNDSILGDVV